MAATAKGCQSKSAEQHNQERRAAKQRKLQRRKAEAAKKRIKDENYAAGFKFQSDEGRKIVELELVEKALNERQREAKRLDDDLQRRSDVILNA